MNRPYIFCHMLTSIDGKIMGTYLDTAAGESAGDAFYRIAFGKKPHYHHQGWLSGRITTDDNFTLYGKPALDENAPQVPEGDFVIQQGQPMYYVSVDPSGKLGWTSNQITYQDTTAQVLEILTGKASNSYKAFLRKMEIPYLIAGDEVLDYELAMEKVKNLFGIETLMLGGGGVLNWSFLQAGMCDELSVVIAPSADGSSETPSLFETRGGFAGDESIEFDLESCEVLEGGSIWLRYWVRK